MTRLPNTARRRLRPALSVAALIAIAVPGAAQAATASTTMSVTATVLTACVVSTTNLAFGNYNPTAGTNVDATATITVNCTTGTSYTVGLNAGTGSGASVSNRKMTSGANQLGYALYSDSGHSTNWGNTPGTDTPAATVATTTAATHTVYGRIAASQNVPAGSYADTVTITVNY